METAFSGVAPAEMDAARARQAMSRRARLRVMADGQVYPVLSLTDSGFVLAGDADHLRGRVDLYDGGRHLAQCLIVRAARGEGGTVYDFKRATAVTECAARDYAVEAEAPVAYLTAG